MTVEVDVEVRVAEGVNVEVTVAVGVRLTVGDVNDAVKLSTGVAVAVGRFV